MNFSRTTLQAGSQQPAAAGAPPPQPKGKEASDQETTREPTVQHPAHALFREPLSRRFTCRPDVPWPRPLLLFEPMQNRRKEATRCYFTGKSLHHDEHIGRFPSADRYTTGPYHLSQPPTPSIDRPGHQQAAPLGRFIHSLMAAVITGLVFLPPSRSSKTVPPFSQRLPRTRLAAATTTTITAERQSRELHPSIIIRNNKNPIHR